jgi:hypothetical protein
LAHSHGGRASVYLVGLPAVDKQTDITYSG